MSSTEQPVAVLYLESCFYKKKIPSKFNEHTQFFFQRFCRLDDLDMMSKVQFGFCGNLLSPLWNAGFFFSVLSFFLVKNELNPVKFL